MQRHEVEEMRRATAPFNQAPGFIILQGLMYFALNLLGWAVVPFELVLRRDFGERYLGIVRLVLALNVYLWFTVMMAGIESQFSRLMLLLLPVFIVLAIYHKIAIARRFRDRTPWHSRSFGISHLHELFFRPFDDWTLYRFMEPGLVVVLGVLLTFVHDSLAYFCIAGGIGMFIRAQIFYSQQRDQYLDRMDSLIEAEYWSGEHKGSDKDVTAGFSPVRMSADLAAMIEKSEAELARRGVRIPVEPSLTQPFEDIDAAVRASMTSAETRPTPVIKRPESELETPAGTGRSSLTPRPATTQAPPTTPVARGSLATFLKQEYSPVSQSPTPSPQPTTTTTPPPKPEDEWGDY